MSARRGNGRERTILVRRILELMADDGAWFDRPRSNGDRPLLSYRQSRPSILLIADHGVLQQMLVDRLIRECGSELQITPKGTKLLRRDEGARQVAKRRSAKEIGGPIILPECPLDWLRKRNGRNGQPLLSAEQYEAGQRFRQDFTAAGLEPRMGVDWSAVRVDASRSKSDEAGKLDALRRFRNAVDSAGAELADILIDICCFRLGLEDVEQKRQWPRRSGRVVLTLALDRMARHYGLVTTASAGSRTLRHWEETSSFPTSD